MNRVYSMLTEFIIKISLDSYDNNLIFELDFLENDIFILYFRVIFLPVIVFVFSAKTRTFYINLYYIIWNKCRKKCRNTDII